jgi:hypothetical protein
MCPASNVGSGTAVQQAAAAAFTVAQAVFFFSNTQESCASLY